MLFIIDTYFFALDIEKKNYIVYGTKKWYHILRIIFITHCNLKQYIVKHSIYYYVGT